MRVIKSLEETYGNSIFFSNRYQRIVDKLPAIIYESIYTPEGIGKCIYISSKCEEITGINPDLIIADLNNFYSTIHKDDLFRYIVAEKEANENLDIELRIIHFKSKEVRWIHLSSSLCDVMPDGNQLWVGFINDITEKKKNEEMLFKYATTDSLTSLSNRRYFYEIVEKELNKYKNHNFSFSILLLDLDRFKGINDTFGHIIGDEVLKHFVKQINRILRPYDSFGRIGGEEFCILFKETDIEEAKKLASKCREVVERNPLSTDLGTIYLTVSGGLVEVDKKSMEILKLMERADKALYMAKKSGRNRIIYL